MLVNPLRITRAIPFVREFGWLLLLASTTVSADPNASLGLLQAVKKQETPALAPTAVLDMLGLLYFGAEGRTEAQLGALFGGKSQEEVAAAAAKAQRQLPGYQRIGSVWFDDRVAVTTDFLKAVEQQWQFYTSSAPLRTDAQGAAEQVNFWYGQKTNGHINEVVTAANLADQPDMLAVIATALVSPWKDKFSPGATFNGWFYRSSTEKFMVETMQGVAKRPYFADDALQIVELELEAKDFAVLICLPKDARQFDAALAKLNGAYLSDTMGKLKPTEVKLALPKVSFKNSLNWREVFVNSRLSAPFTAGQANFSRINNNDPAPLYIAQLVEEVEIRWNENGVSASSTTNALAAPWGEKPAAVTVNANHPFGFLVYNKAEKDIAFAGIIQSPSQMEVAQ
ncbi:serpin family protein [Cerasicoccus frondis]|uniref:serpin family protein n=1 Tax=Cerasicoccus frondis TaxID=490090 RepID=UPI0028529C86|nr:serpin family protein [Cerasicoccus frondis]